MSEQRKTTGTRKRAPKKDTENKTTRTRKKVAEEQAAPVQQNEEAAPDSLKAEENKPPVRRNRWRENRSMTAKSRNRHRPRRVPLRLPAC